MYMCVCVCEQASRCVCVCVCVCVCLLSGVIVAEHEVTVKYIGHFRSIWYKFHDKCLTLLEYIPLSKMIALIETILCSHYNVIVD